eukprot:CAMPEP_0195105612 /NCGR_PEP_ID=MMETSP0448-20130528/77099_1 /TAXON_ID=66468 /ORGANISM="Heterocapsa triquestra, Strain CCMP 448" /LENGTH=192 /DNA_ID=CAMNT_0040141675 /DNA_START=53 /DNA_END=629 /DNA_ORIENTATION=+
MVLRVSGLLVALAYVVGAESKPAELDAAIGTALATGDECAVDQGGSCALSALQLRAAGRSMYHGRSQGASAAMGDPVTMGPAFRGMLMPGEMAASADVVKERLRVDTNMTQDVALGGAARAAVMAALATSPGTTASATLPARVITAAAGTIRPSVHIHHQHHHHHRGARARHMVVLATSPGTAASATPAASA